jgi:hypothetical protein
MSATLGQNICGHDALVDDLDLLNDPCADCAAAYSVLVGSDKQVAWARRVRRSVLLATEAEVSKRFGGDPNAAAILGWMRSQSSAAWWIDRRDATLRDLVAGWVAR